MSGNPDAGRTGHMTSQKQNLSSLNSFLRGATFYGLTVAVAKFGNFLILPFFWQALSPAEFGLVGIIQLTQALLVPVLSLGLFDGVLRFYLEWNEEERPSHTGSVLTLVVTWLLLISTGLYLCRDVFQWIFVSVPTDPYVGIALATAALTCLNHLPLTLHRIRGEAARYSVLVSLLFLTQSVFSILFVFGFDGGVVGYLLAGAAAQGGWFVFLYLGVAGQVRLNFRWRTVRPILAYSVPMIPSTILDSTISLFDRYFLDKAVPLSAIGVYNVAQQFASLISMTNQSIKSAWLPFVFHLVRENEKAPALVARFSLYYVGLMTPPAVAVAVFGQDVLRLFGAENFYGAARVIPWMVLAAYFQVILASFGRGLDLAKKNRLWVLISVFHVAVSLCALSTLVPRYGIVGASIAVVIAVSARVVLQCFLAHRAYPRPVPVLRLLCLWAIALGAVIICYHIDLEALWESLLWKGSVVAIATTMMAVSVIDYQGWMALSRRGRKLLGLPI